MRTYKIHFIRHGLTEANLEGKYIGKTNLPLCSAGIERLEELKNKIDYPYVELVFSSPLSRCIETAEILYPAFEPTIIDELSEYDFGDFENKTAIYFSLLYCVLNSPVRAFTSPHVRLLAFARVLARLRVKAPQTALFSVTV